MLLTVGRMASCERYKGHDHVIAAIPDLVRRGHDVVYLIIGEGDDRARLEEIARKIGVAERVRFLGAVDQEHLAGSYRMADLFVMPSAGEGFGIAFLEAMASGTPAFGFDGRRRLRCLGGRRAGNVDIRPGRPPRRHRSASCRKARPQRVVPGRARTLWPGNILRAGGYGARQACASDLSQHALVAAICLFSSPCLALACGDRECVSREAPPHHPVLAGAALGMRDC